MTPIQIHYYFEDGSHAMDAFIQNKCESEFLGILKQLSSIFEVTLTVETEPVKEGGLIRVFHIHPKRAHKYAEAKIKLVTECIKVVITSMAKVPENLVNTILENQSIVITDKKGNPLEGEEFQAELVNLKLALAGKTAEVNKSNLIRKKKSNFYQYLSDLKKITAISFQTSDNDEAELNITKDQFKQFVLATDKLPPIEIEEAIIEIIAPVLKKGNFKWLGYYEGSRISFTMKSPEFEEQVQTAKIKFVNGTNINCFLVIQKKINSEGQERIMGYTVEKVNSYYESDKPLESKVEIKETKKVKAKKEVEKVQLQLF